MRKQWIPGRIFYFERPGYEAIFMLVSQARPNQFQCRLLSVSPKYLCHSGNFQCTRLQPYTVVKVVSGMGQDPVIEVAILG